MKKIDSFTGEYGFLSNFTHSPITRCGITVPTAEHAFQMMKTATYDEMKYVAESQTPAIAKARGRKITMRKDWESVKYKIMYLIQLEKYRQNPDLREKLLATGDVELEEGNYWHDNIWGNCHCSRCSHKEGRNMLGKILMEVRNELRNKEFC